MAIYCVNFGVNFIFQKFCPCKKNDNYKVWINLDNCRILFWRSIMKRSDDDWMSCFADYQNGRSKPFNGDIFLKYYSATEAVLATKSLWDIFLGHPIHSLTLQQSTCNYAFYVFASYCDQHHTKVSNSIWDLIMNF